MRPSPTRERRGAGAGSHGVRGVERTRGHDGRVRPRPGRGRARPRRLFLTPLFVAFYSQGVVIMSRGKQKSTERTVAQHPRHIEGLEINPVEDGFMIYRPDADRVHYLNHTAVLILELSN